MIITICSSMKFESEIMDVYKSLSKHGHLVFLPVFHAGGFINEKDLIKLHLQKISKSDAIFVVDINSYIGNSVKFEIAYAETLGLPVYYYSKDGLNVPDIKEEVEKPQIYGHEI